MADATEDLLVADLRSLGLRAAPETDVEVLAARVLNAIPQAGPDPRRTLLRVALAALAVLVALVATPPVRATVADWFGFGGVRVERGEPDRTGGEGAAPPRVGDVADAAAAVAFPVLLPTALGEPDVVGVGRDRRVVSMTWGGGDEQLRVDQFDGALDYAVAKRAPRMRFVSVAGTDALWFPTPHDVVLLDPDGSRRTESARLAGQTLVWPTATTTLRLEGDLSLAEAVRIAESAIPVG